MFQEKLLNQQTYISIISVKEYNADSFFTEMCFVLPSLLLIKGKNSFNIYGFKYMVFTGYWLEYISSSWEEKKTMTLLNKQLKSQYETSFVICLKSVLIYFLS